MKKIATLLLASCVMTSAAFAQVQKMEMTTDVPVGVATPDVVKTSIGTMNYFDGMPSLETVDMAYDFQDKMNAVKAFEALVPSLSVYELREGQASVGAKECYQICIFDQLMDSKSLFLTGNTSTMYAMGFLDLKKDGPTVIELPKGMLGVLNDMGFLFMQNLGAAGPDKGQGGKYLVLPPGYKGNVPDGYFVVQSKTYGVWNFMRGYLDNGIEAAAMNIRNNLKVYPLSQKEQQPTMEFINISGEEMNTIIKTDYEFWTKANKLIQEEPIEGFLDLETRGLLRSLGIVKGQEFKPDARMKANLTDALKIGDAIARSITYYPRNDIQFAWEDPKEGWVVPFAEHDASWVKDGARKIECQLYYHYNCIVVTPAMAAAPGPGKGSEYVFASFDSKDQILKGDQNYVMTLPPDVPVADFWAITLYDTQTRSQLQTDQQFPTVDTYTKGLKMNKDGSTTIYIGKDAPKSKKLRKNWLQTVPGKSFFVCLRMYGPTQPWIEGTWRPSKVTLVD